MAQCGFEAEQNAKILREEKIAGGFPTANQNRKGHYQENAGPA